MVHVFPDSLLSTLIHIHQPGAVLVPQYGYYFCVFFNLHFLSFSDLVHLILSGSLSVVC